MLTPIPASECDVPVRPASACLDGELIELEAAFLGAHRGACADCEAFAAGIELTTVALRATPLSEPSRPLVLAGSGARLAS